MKIIFFGTPDYVLPVLERLYKQYGRGPSGIAAVVTQSPKEAGRNKFIERSPIDNWAYKHKIPVIYDLSDIPDADLGIVAAYGKIIPQEIIKKFGNGILNIHPSLLPLWRGASPIQATIAAGEIQTGVSIIKMDELMDHGPIVSRFKEEILAEDSNQSLRKRLFERSSQVLVEMIPHYLTGKIQAKEQDHQKATFTKIIKKDDGFIEPTHIKSAMEAQTANTTFKVSFIKDFSQEVNATNIFNLFRALNPWPGIWTNIILNKGSEPKRLKITNLHVETSATKNDPYLVLDEVQLESKNPVTWKQFVEGYPEAFFPS